MIRSLTILVFVGLASFSNAQLVDNFTDGDFILNPTWDGDVADFVIDGSNRLRLNGSDASDESYLSTPSESIYDAIWEFKVGFDGLSSGGLSGSNRMFVYLVADGSNLEDSPNGYYVLIGNSNDEISLYSTASSTPIIDGDDGVTESVSGLITVRVTRDEIGYWELLIDSGGGNSLISQGTSLNTDFLSSAYFGIRCDYTSTRRTSFFFDDFNVMGTKIPDLEAPEIRSVEAVSATEIEVQFTEAISRSSAETIANYRIDNGANVLSAVQNVLDPSLIHLTTSGLFNGQFYTLFVDHIEDENGNVILANTQVNFRYLVVAQAVPGDIVINEFLADPSVENDLPNADFVELFNRSDKFLDLAHWILGDNRTNEVLSSFVLGPGEYLLICDDEFESEFRPFGDVLSVVSFPNFNASSADIVLLKNDADVTIAEISYASQLVEDGVSLELVNPNDPCLSERSYRLSLDPSGGTPGRQNSVFDDSPDTTLPSISSFNVEASLRINFSEVLDASSILSGTYLVEELTVDEVIFVDDFPASVEITFFEPIVKGTVYALTVSGITDCSGNLMPETSIDFGLGRSPTFNEIIISELFFDPDPAIGLPEREYVEIYNATDNILTTAGMSLSDATSNVTLPAFMLFPGSYYVLTSTSASSEFSLNNVGVSSFPSLNNSGELLRLLLDSDLIFSVSYTPDWHEEEKVGGGYSLEMKDLENPCLEAVNWGSSQDLSGGTPGRANSLQETIPDSFGPQVLEVTAVASDTIIVAFDECILPSSTERVTIGASPTLHVEQVIFNVSKPKELFLVLVNELIENEPVRLTINGAKDCNGNHVTANSNIIALPSRAQLGEVLLSEVLFNPRPNGVDFVEIYNASKKYLNLKGWGLARMNEERLNQRQNISLEVLVMAPGEYLAITTDDEVLFNNYPLGDPDRLLEIDNLPRYNDDEGVVVLLNDSSEIQDIFTYNESMHYNLLEDVEGVSLERVTFSQSANDLNSWRSAASTAGFATPGRPNSQSVSDVSFSGEIKIAPKVFIPGNTGSGRDFTTINYQFDQPGKFANIIIYDHSGRRIKNLAEGVSLATSGLLQWDGTTNAGNIASMGYYLVRFEVYDSRGNLDILRETVVVGRTF